MGVNGYEQRARAEKAVAIEAALRLAGCTTVAELDALDGDGRRNAEAAAGVFRASAETWAKVRGYFEAYDALRAEAQA